MLTEKLIVIQFHTATNQRFVHEIFLSQNWWPQQISSLNSFLWGSRSLTEKRNRNKGFIYMGRHVEDFEIDCKFQDYTNILRIQHHSAWDFYRYIGFDWKKKRWI